MKRLVVAAFSVLSTPASLSAQVIRFGFKAGVGAGYRQLGGWGIEARYVGSFTSIYYPSGGPGLHARPRHAGVQLQVSYLLSGH